VLQARDLAPWRQGPLAGHEDAALAQLNLLPPAAAMAGVYTLVDHSRGVWKAPANVGLAGVLRPAVDIGPAEQDDLTNSLDGKSVNAIRSFVGQGVLVWGARTLAGNSQDWRYVNVRRSVAMLAQSCRLALQALVFEPNDAGTWATARAMLTSFLTAVWQRGGLAGAQAQDAFSVQLGLGETMSAQDLLDGVLRVTLLLAVSRPAEFIEISFQQQMQKA
jgi:phage tail sheath protein FI